MEITSVIVGHGHAVKTVASGSIGRGFESSQHSLFVNENLLLLKHSEK